MIKIAHNIIQVEGDNKTAYVSLLGWGITWSYDGHCRCFVIKALRSELLLKHWFKSSSTTGHIRTYILW